MKPKLTPLYPPSMNPVHPGVYHVKLLRRLWGYSRWQKGVWHTACFSADHAAKEKKKSTALYGPSFIGWQGLAEKP